MPVRKKDFVRTSCSSCCSFFSGGSAVCNSPQGCYTPEQSSLFSPDGSCRRRRAPEAVSFCAPDCRGRVLERRGIIARPSASSASSGRHRSSPLPTSAGGVCQAAILKAACSILGERHRNFRWRLPSTKFLYVNLSDFDSANRPKVDRNLEQEVYVGKAFPDD